MITAVTCPDYFLALSSLRAARVPFPRISIGSTANTTPPLERLQSLQCSSSKFCGFRNDNPDRDDGYCVEFRGVATRIARPTAERDDCLSSAIADHCAGPLIWISDTEICLLRALAV